MMHQHQSTTRDAVEKLLISKAYVLKAFLHFCVSIIFVACTNATPSITQAEDLPPIELDSSKFQSKSLLSFDVNLSGRVVKLIERIEISLDGGQTWQDLTSVNIVQSSCSQKCNFTLGLDNIGTKFPEISQTAIGEEFHCMLRGQSRFGVTAPTSFYVKRLKAGFFSVGALGITQVGASAKTLASGLTVKAGRLEARGEHEVTP